MSTRLAFITTLFDRADILSYRHEQPAGLNLLDQEEAAPGDHAAMEP
jgi:hypothetical protein